MRVVDDSVSTYMTDRRITILASGFAREVAEPALGVMLRSAGASRSRATNSGSTAEEQLDRVVRMDTDHDSYPDGARRAAVRARSTRSLGHRGWEACDSRPRLRVVVD